DGDIAPLNKTGIVKPLPKCLGEFRVALSRKAAQIPDDRHRHLLRARRERPRCRCASEQRDELPPLYHSITSSARCCRNQGTSRPSALAVLRFTTSSNLVGACTGRSPGFSPRRMRSTYDAASRYAPTLLIP